MNDLEHVSPEILVWNPLIKLSKVGNMPILYNMESGEIHNNGSVISQCSNLEHLLMLKFLSQPNEVIKYEDMFSSIHPDEFIPGHSTKAQKIYLVNYLRPLVFRLRKDLSNAGLPNNTIETVRSRGFIFNYSDQEII